MDTTAGGGMPSNQEDRGQSDAGRRIDSRQGQFGTYVKPFMVLVFMVLLVFMVVQVLDFQVGLEETRSEVDFEQEIRRDMQQLVECLRVDDEYSGSSLALNASKLEAYDKNYQLREPECAENIQYGYNATVQTSFLPARQVDRIGEEVDVVFAIDDSGSMGPHMQGVQDNVEDFMERMAPGSRAGMFYWADPCRLPDGEDYRGWVPQEEFPERAQTNPDMGPLCTGRNSCQAGLAQSPRQDPPCFIDGVVDLTTDTGEIEDMIDGHGTGGGTEPVDGAVRFAWEGADQGASGSFEFDWRDGVQRMLIVIATEPASRDIYTPLAYWEEAGVAQDEHDIQVHVVAEESCGWTSGERDYVTDGHPTDCEEQWEKMAEYGDGEFYDIHEMDMEEILEDIAGEGFPTAVGDTTCIVPDAVDQGEEVQTAFAIDTTEGMSPHVQRIHDELRDFRNDLSGIHPEVSVATYQNDVADTHPFTDSSFELEQFLDDVDTGGTPPGGVTETLDTVLHDEETFEWWEAEDGVSQSIILVNQEGAHSHGEDCSESLPRLADEAADRDITIYTVADLEDAESGQCAEEIIETLPERTGGEFFEMTGDWEQELERIADIESEETVIEASEEVMCEPTYAFGAQEGSDAAGLQQNIELEYPVTVWHDRDLQTPGTITINMRDGGLERLSGGINAVARQGEEQGEVVERTLQFNTRQELYSDVRTVERPEETTYQLVNAETGSTSVSVTSDLQVGINGRTVFEVEDGTPSTIDFSDPENQFTAHEGAHIEVIVQDLRGEVDIDPIAVRCVEGCGGERIQGIDVEPASDELEDDIELPDDEDADEVGLDDLFMYGFDELRIGAVDRSEESVVCAATTGDDSCVVTRSDDLSEFTLPPGTHLLGIEYDPATAMTTVTQ